MRVRALIALPKAGARTSPSAVINGYFVVGAQPTQAFRRALHRALRDAT
jgi:predicted DsbA family dithiol-disulfide isomerase